MGLKADLLDAILQASFDVGIEEPPDLSDGTFPERLAHYQTEAIANFLTQCEFRITQLNAPIVLENFTIPEQQVDVKSNTLNQDKQPTFTTIRQLGSLIPGAGPAVNLLVDGVELQTRTTVENIRRQGALLPSIDISKDGRRGIEGGLRSDGYVYIGEDPDSQESFDVEDAAGQREFTEVKLFREDIEDLL